jgi:hypothetical protein
MDDKSEQCRDVYAHYGLAMYAAQCVEQGMVNSLVLLQHIPNTIPRLSSKEHWVEQYDAFYEKITSKTMGRLIGLIQQAGFFSDEIEQLLKQSLDKRNWLAHSYFPNRTTEFLSASGREKMIDELLELRDLFFEVDDILFDIVKKVALKYGMSERKLEQIVADISKEANADI